jgi:hypothetical protein
MSQDETTIEDAKEENTLEAETVADEFSLEEYPKDHPLVKTLYKQRAELKELNRKREQYEQASNELETIRQSQLSEQERAVEQAKETTRLAVRMEYAEKLVEAELKSALKGRTLAGDSILEFNKAAFIDGGGDIDTDAIATWVEAHTSQPDAPKPDLGQGARGAKGSLAQIRSREELERMTPQEILAARKDGRLDGLMGKS